MATYRVETDNGVFDVEVEEPKTSGTKDNRLGFLGAGMIGAGSKSGASLKDVPHIAAKAASGFFGGAPEIIAENPVSFAAGGLPLAVQGKEKTGYFPQPDTVAGKQLGLMSELSTGMMNPSTAIRNVYAGALKEPTKRFGVRIMQSVLKPIGPQAKISKRIARTALEEDIKGGFLGMGKMADLTENKLRQVGSEIESIVAKTKGSKSPQKSIEELDNLKNKYIKKGALEAADQVEKTKQDLIGNVFPTEKGGQLSEMTAPQLQEAKTGQYSYLTERSQNPYLKEISTPEEMARKAAARGLKDTLEELAPEISAPNQRYGRLAELAGAIGKRAPVVERNLPFGLVDAVNVAGMASATGGSKYIPALFGGAQRALQMPSIASRVASKAYNFGRPKQYSLAYPLSRYLTEQFSGE